MKKITKYIVDVGYRKFEFDAEQAIAAFDFANLAAYHVADDSTVEIQIQTENENVDM